MFIDSQLVPRRQIYNLLGSICKNPKLLLDDGINLSTNDFGEQFYKIVFGAINNIIMGNIKINNITAIDVDNYLANNIKAYKIFESNHGLDYLNKAINDCNTDIFKQNYDTVKKFTLLRDFNNVGFDISEIYNPDSLDFNEQNKKAIKLEKMSLQDIIDKFNLKILNVKNKWDIGRDKKTYEISDGLDTLIERLNQEPDYGYPFFNGFYNDIFMGMKYGKLMVKSAGTGVGKTRTALMDMVSISCPFIWDLEKGKYISNGSVYSSTFISTELELTEIQTCLLAIISGVNERVIKEGKYSPDIKKRVEGAVEILKQSPITLHYIADFSISDIEQIIEKDILEKNSKFIFFDYLQITPKLSRTIQEEYKMGLREDQILQNFTTRLKHMAEKYNVYISTATQLNRNSVDREQRDASSLRGGSASVDKADHGVQLYVCTTRDLQNIEYILKNRTEKPNFMHVIYKNRGGRNNIIIWSVMNRGNMREKVLFATDSNYNLLTDITNKSIDFV